MASTESNIRFLSGEEILQFWKDHLWKERQDPVREMSSMLLNGGYDMRIYESYRPVHLGIFINNRLIGCNSCHATSATEMRSRGLFVLPEFRGSGLSQKLLGKTEEQAALGKFKTLWSYPKLEALPVYLKFGFSFYADSRQSSSHCYVMKKVNS